MQAALYQDDTVPKGTSGLPADGDWWDDTSAFFGDTLGLGFDDDDWTGELVDMWGDNIGTAGLGALEGALIGGKVGGWWGAAIGAGAGFVLGLWGVEPYALLEGGSDDSGSNDSGNETDAWQGDAQTEMA